MRKELLQPLLGEFNLNQFHSPIEQLFWPSILITPEEADRELEVGESKLGGLPELPHGTEWPKSSNGEPLSFLAQINLKQINDLSPNNSLPKSGFLYFFYDSKSQPSGDKASDSEGFKVIYSPLEAEPIDPQAIPEGLEDENIYLPCPLNFSTDFNLPDYESQAIANLDLSDDELNAYSDLVGRMIETYGCTGGISRLLGHADLIDSCSMSLAKDWVLLLQLDSHDEASMLWGNGGRLYFFIEKAALESGDFSKTWLIRQEINNED